MPFYRPDYHIVVVDPHRPGHELRYHPGEANVRLADAIVVNKIDTAEPAGVDTVLENVRKLIFKLIPAIPKTRGCDCGTALQRARFL